MNMDAYAIWSTMTAKPGKHAEAERFLVEEALPLIRQEPGTTLWRCTKFPDLRG